MAILFLSVDPKFYKDRFCFASPESRRFFYFDMVKLKKKNFTINDLALMVGRGFNATDKRFDGVDKKLDGIDKRFDGVDKKLFEINQRLSVIEKVILEDHRNRIEILEDRFRDFQRDFRQMVNGQKNK